MDINASTRIHFDRLAAPKKKYIVESMSGAVDVIDYGRDGLPDLYRTNAPRMSMHLSGKKARSLLFHNNHEGTFTNVARQAGVEDSQGLLGLD